MACDRPTVYAILEPLIDKKISHLFNTNHLSDARMLVTSKRWILRGRGNHAEVPSIETVAALKRMLRWHRTLDGVWFDRYGVSILFYAILRRDDAVFRALIDDVAAEPSARKRRKILLSRIRKEGKTRYGIPGHATSLHVAVAMGSPMMVEELLRRGVDPNTTDTMGSDAFMLGCGTDNIASQRRWLELIPTWDVNRRNRIVGGMALGIAVLYGTNKMATVQFLIENGADISLCTHSGNSVLMSATDSPDADPVVVSFLLDSARKSGVPNFRDFVNYRSRPRSFKWKLIRWATRALRFVGLLRRHVLVYFMDKEGSTALHNAVQRGDTDIAEILLDAGADSSLRTTHTKANVAEWARRFGPFPAIEALLFRSRPSNT